VVELDFENNKILRLKNKLKKRGEKQIKVWKRETKRRRKRNTEG